MSVIIGKYEASYTGTILACAVLAFFCAAQILWRTRNNKIWKIQMVCILGIAVSFPLSRLLIWYSTFSLYVPFNASFDGWKTSDISVLSFWVGICSVSVLFALLRVIDLMDCLDCLLPSGLLGIAIGKWACLFSDAGISKYVVERPGSKICSWLVIVSAETGEYRLSTYAMESAACFVLFLLLMFYIIVGTQKGKVIQKGNVFWIGFSFYCTFMVVLDSTRYDALFFRQNGFISISQVFGVCGLISAFLFQWCGCPKCRIDKFAIPLFLMLLVAGGYQEYLVQRYSNTFVKCYSIMLSCFLLISFMTVYYIKCRNTRKSIKRWKHECINA